MDRMLVVALLLLLAACSGVAPQATNGSVCHWGEVSYDCSEGRFR